MATRAGAGITIWRRATGSTAKAAAGTPSRAPPSSRRRLYDDDDSHDAALENTDAALLHIGAQFVTRFRDVRVVGGNIPIEGRFALAFISPKVGMARMHYWREAGPPCAPFLSLSTEFATIAVRM